MDVTRTDSAHDRNSQPIKIHSSQGIDVAEAIPKLCKGVMGNEHRLRKLDNVDSIDKAFCRFSVVRKC